MRKVFAIASLLAFSIVLCYCAPKRVVQEPKQPIVTQETRERAIEAEKKAPEEKITEQQIAKIETKELETPKYIEEKITFEDIYFDFDKYDIRPDAKQPLKSLAEWLVKNTSAELLIEGHCDERGTNEYNLALGDRRAKAARDYLLALGIASGRIEMISYGEEKPQCTEQTEECWQKNRRAHFVILKKR